MDFTEGECARGCRLAAVRYLRRPPCPITYCKMIDPVVASDGHSYERTAITEYVESEGEDND